MSPDKSYDEKELLQWIADGDEQAFRRLFNQYQGKLYNYILKITGSPEAAEDTVHDVFMKLWTNREKITEITNLNAYLYRMAHNHAYNGLRRMAKGVLVMAELSNRVTYESADPDHLLLRKEILRVINEAVEKLTPQQKEIFKMSRELGLKQEEMAQKLNISVSTVKKHLTNALNFLRSEISKTYGSRFMAITLIVARFIGK